jgi:hypothetical protein
MGGCLWTERHAYFDHRTEEEHRTEMLAKYLKHRARIVFKQQSSDEEDDLESDLDGGFSDDEGQQEEGQRDLLDFKKEEGEQPLMGDSLSTPSPPEEETKQAVNAEQFVSQGSSDARQPPLTMMSQSMDEGEYWDQDQEFLAGTQAIIIRRHFSAYTRQRKPVWLKPEVHQEPSINQPVEANIAANVKPRYGAEAESILDDYADEPLDNSAAPFFYEDSDEDFPEAKISLPSHVHYLRSPAPALTQDLYHKNLLEQLSCEEKWSTSPLSRLSVQYAPVMKPMKPNE